MSLAASLALIAVLVACSSSSPQKPTKNCEKVPRAAIAAISTGLVGGTNLGVSSMVRDPERSEVWLIAAEIDGPGVEGRGQVGVWATNRPEDPGVIFAVDGFAGQFSDWGKLADASPSEWDLAKGCL